MTAQEMASDEVKKAREKILDWYKQAATIQNHSQTTTSLFKCGKCGSRDTTYYQLQTRR
jgi:transcription elongation factor S-II